MTPVCAACETRSVSCTYLSDPAVPRFAALKTAYGQLQSHHDHLRSIFTQLKDADEAGASALLEQIRRDDGDLEMPKDVNHWNNSADIAGSSDASSSTVHQGMLVK